MKTQKSSREQGVWSKDTAFRIILFLHFTTYSFLLAAQTPSQYHVVRVVGKVESPVLKRELKTGDVIQAKDHLKFHTKESYIIVNSPQTGRKRISGVPDNTPREFLQLLQSFVQPELKSTASRNISLQYLETLQNSMAFDRLLILGDAFVPVNTEKLSLAKPAVIRAWHTNDKKRPVYLTISTDKGFYLSTNSLFGADYDKIAANPPKVVVEYFEDEKEDPMFSPGLLLGSFIPVWVNEDNLALELKALLAALPKSKTEKELFTEISNYLRDEYAPAQEQNLKAWLKEKHILG